MQIYFVIALIFAVLVAIFAIQNSAPVHVQFLFWEIQRISQVLVILGAAAIGALIVLFMGAGKQIKLIWQVRQLTQQNNQLKNEQQKLKQQLNTTTTTTDQTVDLNQNENNESANNNSYEENEPDKDTNKI